MFQWYPLEPSPELPGWAPVPEAAQKLTLEQVWILAPKLGQALVAGWGLVTPAGVALSQTS